MVRLNEWLDLAKIGANPVNMIENQSLFVVPCLGQLNNPDFKKTAILI
jgi:hypothetical protein